MVVVAVVVAFSFWKGGKEDEWSWEFGWVGGGVFGSGLRVRTNGKQLRADNKNSVIRNVTHISHHSGSKSVSSSRKEVVWYQNAKTVTGVSWNSSFKPSVGSRSIESTPLRACR